ncbi:unnamed protein product, partial [Closterium sp. Naga37s-1]
QHVVGRAVRARAVNGMEKLKDGCIEGIKSTAQEKLQEDAAVRAAAQGATGAQLHGRALVNDLDCVAPRTAAVAAGAEAVAAAHDERDDDRHHPQQQQQRAPPRRAVLVICASNAAQGTA